jgi:hypothetical protein
VLGCSIFAVSVVPAARPYRRASKRPPDGGLCVPRCAGYQAAPRVALFRFRQCAMKPTNPLNSTIAKHSA